MGVTDDGTTQQVEDTLVYINEELPVFVAEELQEIMENVKALAIDYCPKETGALSSSINLEGGAISSGNDFFNASVYAGDPSIVNPLSGKPTSDYAMLVHDGHLMRNGMFYEGDPFLDDAYMVYAEDIEMAVDEALTEMGVNTQE
jgi:hypothetical protein